MGRPYVFSENVMVDKVEVQIVANTGSLQSEMKSGADAFEAATGRMKVSAADFAKAYLQAGGNVKSAAMVNALAAGQAAKTMGDDAAAAAAKLAGIGTQAAGLTGLATGLRTAGTEATHLNFATSGVIQEYIRLGHEAMTGNFSRMPGSMVVLASRAGGLQTALAGVSMGLVGAGIVAAGFAAALALIIIRAQAMQRAIEEIKLGAEFAGNVQLTDQQISNLIITLQKIPGVSAAAAEKMVGEFARIKNETTPEIQSMVLMLGDYARVSGQTAEKATESWTKAFNDPLKEASKFIDTFPQVTQSERDMVVAAEQSGNANKAAAAMLSVLSSNLERVGPSLETVTIATARGTNAIDGHSNSMQHNIDLIHQLIEALGGLAPGQESVLQTGIAAANEFGHENSEIIKLTAGINEMKAALQLAGDQAERTSKNINVTTLAAGLDEAQKKLATLTLAPYVENAREGIADVQAAMVAGSAAEIRAEVAKWDAVIAIAKEKGLVSVDAERERGRLLSELHRKDITDAASAAREQLSATRTASSNLLSQDRTDASAIAADDTRSNLERLTAIKDYWAQAKLSQTLTHNDMLEAEREFNSAVKALHTQLANDSKTIRQDEVRTDLEIRKVQLSTERDELQAGVVYQQQSAEQKAAIMRRLVAQLAELDVEELQNERSNYAVGTVEYARYTNEIRLRRAQLNADLAKSDLEMATNFKKSVDQQAKDWSQGLSMIEGLESNFISDLFSRRLTLVQSLQSLTARFIQEELASDIRYWTMRALYSQFGMTEEIKNLHGGLLATLLTEGQKTTAVETGAAARTMAKTTESGAEIPGMIADAVKTIGIDAAKTFANVWAWLSGVMGPAAAGPAAASEAAVLAATGPMMAFERGTDYVPSDMVAYVHEGEMITPAGQADDIRSGRGSQPTMLQADFHIHAIDSQDVISVLRQPIIMRSLLNMFRQGLSDNLSRRPNYGA